MKRLKPEDLPKILTDEIIEILSYMVDEVPQSKEWQEICDALTETDFDKVMDKRFERQLQEEENRIASLTKEEKKAEDKLWKKTVKNAANEYNGLMGTPLTPKEWERKFSKMRKKRK